MGLALLRLKNARKLTLADMGSVIGHTGAAMSGYIAGSHTMSATSWIKATARWPELNDMLIAELDEAEKAAAARQRAFKLEAA